MRLFAERFNVHSQVGSERLRIFSILISVVRKEMEAVQRVFRCSCRCQELVQFSGH